MYLMACYDGSNVAEAAVDLAIAHAAKMDGRILLVTSMEGGPEVPRQDFEIAESKLGYMESRVKEAGLECRALLSVRGLPAGEDLVKVAKEHNVDLIYLGVRRRSKVGKLIFGSAAQYVILSAPRPVVTVK